MPLDQGPSPSLTQTLQMPTDPQVEEKWHVPLAKSTSITMPTSDPKPDFTKKCHYTLQLYTCTHKTWLNKPRIRHVCSPLNKTCNLSPLSPDYPETKNNKNKKDDKNNPTKTRCTNMATKPMEVRMKEVCTKCRPVSLGVKKEARDYERVVEWEEEKVYRVGDEGGRDEKKGGVELDFESEGREPKVEEEKSKGREEYNKTVFASLKEVEIGKDAEGNAVVKPKEVKEFQEVQLWETVKEWPAPARVVQGSVDIAQVADHTSPVPQPPIARPIFGSFANLFIASGKQEKGETEDEDDEPFEIWTVVDEDPDWDKIDTEDAKRGMLWKNSGDWVNVNVQ